MSTLLEKAKVQQSRGSGPAECVMAKALKARPKLIPEAIELILAPEIRTSIKVKILNEAGLDVTDQTLRTKLKSGCKCQWCHDHMGFTA